MTFKFQIFLVLLILISPFVYGAVAEEEQGGPRFRTSVHEGRFYVEGIEEITLTSEELGTILQTFSTLEDPSKSVGFFNVQFEPAGVRVLGQFLQTSSVEDLSFYGSRISGDSAKILLNSVAQTPSLKALSIANGTYGDSFLFHLGILKSRHPLRLLLKDTTFLEPKDNLRNLLFNPGIDELWLVRAALDYHALTAGLESGKGPLKSLWICQGDEETPLPSNFQKAANTYGIKDVKPSGKRYSKRPLPRHLQEHQPAALSQNKSVVGGPPLNPASSISEASRIKKYPSTGNILTLRKGPKTKHWTAAV